MPATAVSLDLVGALVRLGRVLRSTKTPSGVRSAEHLVLAHLDLHGTSRAGDIAEELHMSPSVVSRQVSALEGEGLVRRTSCVDDGRVALIALTESGAERLEEGRKVYREFLAEVLADWDEERMLAATDLLTDLSNHVRRHLANVSARH